MYLLRRCTVDKKGLIKFVALEVGLPERIVKPIVNSLLNHIITGVTLGCEIQLIGFGKFSKVVRPSRIGWNPGHGVKMNLPPITVIKFEAGKVFKDSVRGIK